MPAAAATGPTPRRVDERLRKRTRQLALANALGARLAAMTDVDEILEAAVDELHRAFGYFLLRGRPRSARTATSSAPPAAATRSSALGVERLAPAARRRA